MGLLNAIRRYGLPDEGFAGYAVHRIRGAILDELRALDWRPRQRRQKYHQMKDSDSRNAQKKLGGTNRSGQNWPWKGFLA